MNKFFPKSDYIGQQKSQIKELLETQGHKNLRYSGRTIYNKDGSINRGPGYYAD